MKLPSILFKARAKDLEQLPQESFMDVLKENLFFRRLTLTMSIGSGGLILILAWQAYRQPRPEIIMVSQPTNVRYVDDTAPGEGALSPSANPPSALLDQDNKPAPPVTGSRTDVRGTHERKRSKEGNAVEEEANESKDAEGGPQSGSEANAKSGLWTLLQKLNEDPRREILEKKFRAEGIEIVFRQASPSGLISLDILNEGDRPVYMPVIEVAGKRSTVYLERRVLEKDTKSAGVIQVDEMEASGNLNLTFKAANLKPIEMTLEVPGW